MPPNASGSPDLPNLTFGVLVRSRWRQLHEPVDHLEEPRTLFVAQLVFFRRIAGDRLADDHALRLPEPLRRLAQRRDGLLVERERQLCHTAILPYSNTAGGRACQCAGALFQPRGVWRFISSRSISARHRARTP